MRRGIIPPRGREHNIHLYIPRPHLPVLRVQDGPDLEAETSEELARDVDRPGYRSGPDNLPDLKLSLPRGPAHLPVLLDPLLPGPVHHRRRQRVHQAAGDQGQCQVPKASQAGVRDKAGDQLSVLNVFK